MDVKAIIGLIVATIFLIAVAVPTSISVLDDVINPTLVTAESASHAIMNNSLYTVANTPIDYSRGQPIITNGTTVLTTPANYTLYTLNAANSSYNGTIKITNVDYTTFGNTTLTTYYYQQPGFDANTVDQTVLKIIPLAFVIMLLVIVFLTMAI
jgi:hypothetical protein